MKKFKKAMALSLALAMGLSLCACGDKEEKTTEKATEAATTEAAAEDGDTTAAAEESTELTLPAADSEAIYIYSWNTELGDRLKFFYEKYPEYTDLVKYENLGLGGTSDEYKAAIENALTAGGEKVPSIIAADNDVALYFLNTEAVVPVSEIGITSAMYSNAYQYTVDYATLDGELKGLSWQATPGCFIYRTDIAEEVLGTSDPAEVQEYVKDWDTFFTTADTMKAAGYAMLSGPDDVKYVMMDQRTQPWVTDDVLNIDACVTDYLEMSKKLYDGDYTKKTAMWDENWNTNVNADVFGYFGCTWFTYWCIASDPELEGKRMMVQGPADYHWGGTYLSVTDQCPNKELAALVLYSLCCDTDVMYALSDETLDFVNNKAAVAQLVADGKGASPVLGGQNPLEIWNAAAEGIVLDKATEYDSTLNGFLDNASGAYNSGELATIDDAIQAVKDKVSETYQFITVE